MALKANLAANFVGQGWRVLMALAFVPLYIRYLGIEAYGLIGVFAVLQAWLGLLDMGLRPTLVREMARFTGGAHDARTIWDLLRSVEVLTIAIAALVAIGVWAASGWLASNWVQSESIPTATVAQAFALMGWVTALQFLESIYSSSIAGLQRQVVQNAVASGVATLRGLGAVAVLAWASPTITAFFLWQGLVSVVAVLAYAAVVYRVLPPSPVRAEFSVIALKGIGRYAGGMVGITLLSLLLTQVDKLLLSRLLPLEQFAYYALAGVVAAGLGALCAPIPAAFYPRFTQLVSEAPDRETLPAVYHLAAQLVTILMGAAAVILIVFGDRVLWLWTQDRILTASVAPLLAVIALGTLLNGLMWIPYHLQLAHGWTSLTIKVNIAAVAILIPAILWAVPVYGAIGAAWAWVALNLCYILFHLHFMHRRLLPAEKWRWYFQDVGIPLVAAISTASVLHWLMPTENGVVGEIGVLLLSSGAVLLVAALSANRVRYQIMEHPWVRARMANRTRK
jgi:O-antigen/teichoic acid export membrane protein